MPRAARCWDPSVPAHLTDRGHEGAPIYRSDEDRRFALISVARALADTGSRLLAYAVMRNHVHLFVCPDREPLGHTMLRFKTRVARRHRKRRGERGPVFQGRFHSNVLVDRDEQALPKVLAYVLLNPVRAGIVTLEELETWPWTAVPELLGLADSRLVDRDYVLSCLDPVGRDPAALRDLLRAEYAADTSESDLPPKCVPVSRRIALEAGLREGQTGLIGAVAADVLSGVSLRARHEQLVRAGWTPERIVAWCCVRTGASHEIVRLGGRRRPEAIARATSCAIGCANGWSAIQMAVATGVSAQAAAVARDRGRARLLADGLDVAAQLSNAPTAP